MMLLGIDPGTTHSGVVLFDTARRSISWAEAQMVNGAVLDLLHDLDHTTRVACETMQASYAATVGESVVGTLIWIGRFVQQRAPLPVHLITRQQVKAELCNGNTKANDAGVRQALIDKLGPPGTKRDPGPTYGVTSHAWSALAVAYAAMREAERYGTDSQAGARTNPADAARDGALDAPSTYPVARGDESARATHQEAA